MRGSTWLRHIYNKRTTKKHYKSVKTRLLTSSRWERPKYSTNLTNNHKPKPYSNKYNPTSPRSKSSTLSNTSYTNSCAPRSRKTRAKQSKPNNTSRSWVTRWKRSIRVVTNIVEDKSKGNYNNWVKKKKKLQLVVAGKLPKPKEWSGRSMRMGWILGCCWVDDKDYQLLLVVFYQFLFICLRNWYHRIQ